MDDAECIGAFQPFEWEAVAASRFVSSSTGRMSDMYRDIAPRGPAARPAGPPRRAATDDRVESRGVRAAVRRPAAQFATMQKIE
jgi:hypothetical protein